MTWSCNIVTGFVCIEVSQGEIHIFPWSDLNETSIQCLMEKIYYKDPNDNTAQSLRWRHNGRDGVSNHLPHDCLLNRLFRRRSKTTSKPRVTGLCAGISPETGEFPAQMASNAENVSIWWRYRDACPYHHWSNTSITLLTILVLHFI